MAAIEGTSCLVRHSISKMFNNAELSDVNFVFSDGTEFCSHKFILSIRSSVFTTMFYGSIPEATTNKNIEIVDISSVAFSEFLRFIYTDKVNLTIENLKEVIYAAHKYEIKQLGIICAQFLAEQLTSDNVIHYLDHLYIYENESSVECLQFIDLAISGLIEKGNKALFALDAKPLKEILTRNSLKINEITLFKFLLKWTEISSKNFKTIQNRKETFIDLFSLIRFPSMDLIQFGESFNLEPHFFTDEEILAIFKYSSTVNANCSTKDILSYSTTKRFNSFDMLELEKTGTFPKIDTIKTVTFTVRKMLEINHFCISYHEGSMETFVLKLFEADAENPIFSASIRSSATRIMCQNKLILKPELKYTLHTESDEYSNLEYSKYGTAKYCSIFKFPSKFETHIAGICYTTVITKRQHEN